MIPTARRIEHARGFIALGLINEASDELEAIDWPDRLKREVLEARVELYTAAKQWDMVEAMKKALARAGANRP